MQRETKSAVRTTYTKGDSRSDGGALRVPPKVLPTSAQMSLPRSENISTSPASTKGPVKYGELIVLGCNGSLPSGDKGRRKSRFALCRRKKANGVKPSTVHASCTPQAAKAVSNKEQHSISYTLSRTQTVVVEYDHDSSTDMFQVCGVRYRHAEAATRPDRYAPRQLRAETLHAEAATPPDSYAPRQLRPPTATPPDSYTPRPLRAEAATPPDRYAPRRYTPRPLHAEAATRRDATRPGSSAPRQLRPENATPPDSYTPPTATRRGRYTPRRYTPGQLRPPRLHAAGNQIVPRQRGQMVEPESNELVDGSLVDLCGATLLWRTAEGLARTPTVKHLEALRQELNAGRPQCPVGLNTLAFPSMRRKDVVDERQPWAYLRCGHVHGYHGWGGRRDPEVEAACPERECPMCRTRGPYKPLWLGCETGFYVDAEPPTHAFAPCGHVCSEKTTAYWSQIPLPHGTHAFHAACPFCIEPLGAESGCIRLIFQSPLD
uniref:E3 ubiquitin-protein ligase pellino homolog 1-like n=1 Tax=Gasterosteus aculeatus aculeatus TaxID=481459 RepID=UPI001A98801D|nr:E3 ubiquitin-protein ligase pellino homolog 1-like [Gasterosteus aculeatus aculeatus]